MGAFAMMPNTRGATFASKLRDLCFARARTPYFLRATRGTRDLVSASTCNRCAATVLNPYGGAGKGTDSEYAVWVEHRVSHDAVTYRQRQGSWSGHCSVDRSKHL